jgi:hypothetical protein
MINKATATPYIQLICNPYEQLTCNPYEHSDVVNTRVTIDVMQKDLTRDEVLEVFESFLKVMGYHISSKEALCIADKRLMEVENNE